MAFSDAWTADAAYSERLHGKGLTLAADELDSVGVPTLTVRVEGDQVAVSTHAEEEFRGRLANMDAGLSTPSTRGIRDLRT